MKTLKSTDYTLFINGTNVTMKCNHSNLPYSLSSLLVTTHDILFYMATQHMGNDDKAQRLQALIIDTCHDNLDRLNKITAQNFAFI